MGAAKVAITIEEDLLKRIDRLGPEAVRADAATDCAGGLASMQGRVKQSAQPHANRRA
jgi:hypothetical protein